MPDWLTDLNKIGALSSIIGLVVTGFLFVEARKIKDSFLRRARLPQVTRELVAATSSLSTHLKEWSNDVSPALETFSKIVALLENIKTKLPSEEKKKVDEYLSRLHPKKFIIINRSLADLSEDEAWDRYTRLSGLITTLQQLTKDSKWD